jgi:hypothetical protein
MTGLWIRAYLVAWLFWLTVALGCWGWELVHNLTGGNWGHPLRPLLAAGAATLPWLALGFVPLAFSLPDLYPWASESALPTDYRLQHKHLYLNVPFFLSRTAIYFFSWIGARWIVGRTERQVLATESPAATSRLQGSSGLALVLYFVTVSFAAIDWCMSLEPQFTSVAYGIVFLVSLSLAGLAWAIAAENWGAVSLSDATAVHGNSVQSRDESCETAVAPGALHDQGNLLLAFVMLWAYVSFCQFLIIWYSDLPEEVVWYSRRFTGGWQTSAVLLAGLNFGLPFALLLSRDVKRCPRLMGLLATSLVAVHWVEIVWLVEPAFESSELSTAWRDLLATFAIGVPWIAIFGWRAASRKAYFGKCNRRKA